MDTKSVNDWTRKVYPERLHSRLQETIEYLSGHPDVQSDEWLYQTAHHFMAPSAVLLSAEDEFMELPVEVIVDEVVALISNFFAENSIEKGQGFRFVIPDAIVHQYALQDHDCRTQLSVYLYNASCALLREVISLH